MKWTLACFFALVLAVAGCSEPSGAELDQGEAIRQNVFDLFTETFGSPTEQAFELRDCQSPLDTGTHFRVATAVWADMTRSELLATSEDVAAVVPDLQEIRDHERTWTQLHLGGWGSVGLAHRVSGSVVGGVVTYSSPCFNP